MKQGILEQSAVAKYPVGTRYVEGDRVFRYCKAGETIVAPMKAGWNGTKPKECNTAAVEYAAGTTQVTILDTDATHGKDYYKNGYIWIQPVDGTPLQMYKIKSSTAGDGISITLTLYEVLTQTVTATTWITAWPNIYSNIVYADTQYMSMVCVPLIPVTVDYYFWGQTWGPCFGTTYNVVPGYTAKDREVYFHEDGALRAGDDAELETGIVRQRAGFIISNTTDGGDQFYMLQLSP